MGKCGGNESLAVVWEEGTQNLGSVSIEMSPEVEAIGKKKLTSKNVEKMKENKRSWRKA